jgi:hypothetical protein
MEIIERESSLRGTRHHLQWPTSGNGGTSVKKLSKCVGNRLKRSLLSKQRTAFILEANKGKPAKPAYHTHSSTRLALFLEACISHQAFEIWGRQLTCGEMAIPTPSSTASCKAAFQPIKHPAQVLGVASSGEWSDQRLIASSAQCWRWPSRSNADGRASLLMFPLRL